MTVFAPPVHRALERKDRRRGAVLELVQTLHEAFHTESRWIFVLIIGLFFGLIASALAYVVDTGYQRSLQEKPIRIGVVIQKLLTFPNAIQDSTPPRTLLEEFSADQTPRKIFDVLIQEDEKDIGRIPRWGPSLTDFLHEYYQYQGSEMTLENELRQRISGLVTIQFPQAWEIYLRYAVFRFNGLSKEEVMAMGNFLNYGITWDGAEEIYAKLTKNSQLKERCSAISAEHDVLIGTINRLKVQ